MSRALRAPLQPDSAFHSSDIKITRPLIDFRKRSNIVFQPTPAALLNSMVDGSNLQKQQSNAEGNQPDRPQDITDRIDQTCSFEARLLEQSDQYTDSGDNSQPPK
jgi:hypothetical protein